MSAKRKGPKPRSHHIDQRADQVLATMGTDNDQMLTTRQVANMLGVSMQWLEIGRHRNYGPPCIQLGERCVRYRRDDIARWLEQRMKASIKVA